MCTVRSFFSTVIPKLKKTGSTTWKRHFLGLSDLTPFERRKMESHFLTHKMADRRFNPLR